MDYENFDMSLIVELQDGKYALSGGVLEGKTDSDMKLGWIGILPLREEAHGKYKSGEKIPDDAIVPGVPPFGFAFNDQEKVNLMIHCLESVRTCMAEAGIPYSSKTEDDPNE